MENWTVIGVDPGKNGCITVLTQNSIEHYFVPVVGKEIDLHALGDMILDMCSKCDVSKTVVIIEDVHALAGSAAGSTFAFGGIFFALRMAFIMCGLKLVQVTPKKWQKEMYEGVKKCDDIKAMSVLAAKRLFPNHDLRKTKRAIKPDNNLTDSLLIAEYGRRHYL